MTFKDLENKYHIKIYTNSVVIPKQWFKAPLKTKIKNLNKQSYQRAVKGLSLALRKYPKDILYKYLPSITIVNELENNDVPYGGTFSNKGIIIAIYKNTGVRWISNTFHHELNHFLVWSCKYNFKEWKELNNKKFRYGAGGIKFILNGEKVKTNKNIWKLGFINSYGKTDVWEDIATITEYSLSNLLNFKRICKNYKIINNKFRLLIKFYEKLSLNCFG